MLFWSILGHKHLLKAILSKWLILRKLDKEDCVQLHLSLLWISIGDGPILIHNNERCNCTQSSLSSFRRINHLDKILFHIASLCGACEGAVQAPL